MNSIEKKMVDILKELRQSHGVTAVKINLEAEGIRPAEILRTKEIVMSAGVGLTVKLGGCEALSDLRLSKMYGVSGIMAPMIESRFALEKYLDMVESEYDAAELEDMKLLINIETADGYQKIDEILAADNIQRLAGIVLGRTDLCSAVKASGVNAPEILDIAKAVFAKAKERSLHCIVGGGTTVKSIPFYQQLKGLIGGFETRKVVFADYAKAEAGMAEGIPLALKFELHWYELKQQYYGKIYNEDAAKMKSISALLGL
ncbi:MAG: aldolase/citrate lyase family protein [Negativicutes bacterium]|nr:aldolase/citrate lyase family protein [Negativicutes bacterium]